MRSDFSDPHALVPQELDAQESRAYEERTADVLREHFIGSTAGPVIVDQIEIVGARPETLILFRYHHHPSYIQQHADLVEGHRAEAAKLWEYAIDPEDQYSDGKMDPPPRLAAAIGSAFDAAELPPVDPVTLTPLGRPPNVFPRVMSDAVAEQMRRKYEAWRMAQDERDSGEAQNED